LVTGLINKREFAVRAKRIKYAAEIGRATLLGLGTVEGRRRRQDENFEAKRRRTNVDLKEARGLLDELT
jgi:hypothetical protein